MSSCITTNGLWTFLAMLGQISLNIIRSQFCSEYFIYIYPISIYLNTSVQCLHLCYSCINQNDSNPSEGRCTVFRQAGCSLIRVSGYLRQEAVWGRAGEGMGVPVPLHNPPTQYNDGWMGDKKTLSSHRVRLTST